MCIHINQRESMAAKSTPKTICVSEECVIVEECVVVRECLVVRECVVVGV